MSALATRRYICSDPDTLALLQGSGLTPYRLDVSTQSAVDGVLLDTFDNALWRKDRALLQMGRSLSLLGADGGRHVRQPARPIRFKADIRDEAMRQALTWVPAIRCLSAELAFRLQSSTAQLVDDEEKTCARLRLWLFVRDEYVCSYIELEPLRGYPKAARKLEENLLATGARSIDSINQAWQALGHDQRHYRSNPKLAVEDGVSIKTMATRLIGSYLSVARSNETGIVKDSDSEFLHDYRVSLRRIRSLVALSNGVWPEPQRQELKRRFSTLMTVTNRLRDLDVYLLDQSEYYALLPSSLHAGVDEIFAAFRKERRREQNKLRRHLQSESYWTQVNALVKMFDAEGNLQDGPDAGQAAHFVAHRLIRKHHKRCVRMALAIDAHTADEQVHELRLQCKKLRYLLDFFRPLFPGALHKQVLKALKVLQDNLGRFNDYAMQQRALQQFLQSQTGKRQQPSTAMIEAIGALVAMKNQLQLAERSRVMTNCESFAGRATRQQFKQLLGSANQGED